MPYSRFEVSCGNEALVPPRNKRASNDRDSAGVVGFRRVVGSVHHLPE